MLHLDLRAGSLARLVLVLSPAALFTNPAVALQGDAPSTEIGWSFDSGPLPSRGVGATVIASELIQLPGAEWMRVHFGDVELAGRVGIGGNSILRLTSLEDGYYQELDEVSLAQWRGTSAHFNGDAVLVELISGTAAGSNRLELTHVDIGVPSPGGSFSSICGGVDERVFSTDPRVGRTSGTGCTVFLIDDCNECILTAGHCGSIGAVHFNVPQSDPNGSPNFPPPGDQYAVDSSSRQRTFVGGGRDWQYFGVFPNSNTGLTPGEAQGQTFEFVAPPSFNTNQEIRITGHGVDTEPPGANRSQQTSTGSWSWSNSLSLGYFTDTEGANSGSPIIHEASGTCIGIHTSGGCGATGGNNSGTSFLNDDLQYAIANARGVCAFGIQVLGELPRSIPTSVGAPVSIRVASDTVPGSVLLNVRTSQGPFTSVPMQSLGNEQWEALLQTGDCFEVAEYYFTAIGVEAGPISLPTDAPQRFFTAPAGTLVAPIFTDDFQTDQGWTTGGNASTGLWVRADPVNSITGDPAADADGSGLCFVTGNAGGEDVDGGEVVLTSPSFDTTGGAVVSWAYWISELGTDTLSAQDYLRVDYSLDGSSWNQVRDYSTSRLEWRRDFLRFGLDLPAGETTRLRFRAADNGGGDRIEAALDDFRVEAVDCSALASFCNGDGGDQQGCTDCPCTVQNAPEGTIGGCLNSAGTAARLIGTGVGSLAADTLRFELTGGTLSTFGVLVSGSVQLPQNPTAPCPTGAGIVAAQLDGLRCVGGSLVRHGSRSIDANGEIGATGPAWGPPNGPPGGLSAGFAAGETRYFQIFYREDFVLGCNSGQNTTQAVGVTFEP